MGKIFMFAIAYIVVFSLIGWMNNQNGEAANNGDNNEAESVGSERDQEGNRGADNHNNTNQFGLDNADQTHLEIAEEAVDRNAALDKVNNTNVSGPNQTAKVKTTDADHDFPDPITDYGEGITEGPPAEDLFKEEFKGAVQMVFSDAP